MAAGLNGNRIERDGEGEGKGGVVLLNLVVSFHPKSLHTLFVFAYHNISPHTLYSVLFSFIAEFVLHICELYLCVWGDNRKLITIIM